MIAHELTADGSAAAMPAIVERFERTMRGRGLARAEVERILDAQVSRVARLAAADDVIVNDAGFDTLATATGRLH